MSATTRRAGPDNGTETIVLGAVGIGVLLVAYVTVTAAIAIGYPMAGVVAPTSSTPQWIGLAVRGQLQPPAPVLMLLVVFGAGALAIVIAAVVFVVAFLGKRPRIDRAAAHMGRGRAIHELTFKGVQAKAKRLGISSAEPGVFLGRTVAGGLPLYTSWEDVGVCIAGPRVGKTTSLVIPAILAAPGAVVTTSNKRDVVDATRAFRARLGPVWVFDPQGVADEEPSWWWNPLSYVVDEVKAGQMASLLSAASRTRGETRQAFFDGSAETLIAGMLLAAARAQLPLSQVYLWLTDSTDEEAAYILRTRGDLKSAESVKQIVDAPDKQKGGIYGTAQQIMAFMINSKAVRWVEKDGPADARPEFNPAEFVRSSGSLYPLSKEGGGSAGPLVTALTVAVTEAGEEYAKTQPGGRLAVPLELVLDEAANVCRWYTLPDLYSHYGSRGITILTILQSWSQGVEVWGREGMLKLWTAANAKIYMGGVDEEHFLGELSTLIGDFEISSRSTSRSANGSSSSYQSRRERILDPSDLRAMPRGRAILMYSGAPAVLLRTVPWMQGKHAVALQAALRGEEAA